jgi:hypothetical protein
VCVRAHAGRGLEIFRIEKLKVVQITDTTKFGKFFSGDSYIVLAVCATHAHAYTHAPWTRAPTHPRTDASHRMRV